jgi:hypothetical protein
LRPRSAGNQFDLFYAGHGIAIHGTNYLPPVDAGIKSEMDVVGHSGGAASFSPWPAARRWCFRNRCRAGGARSNARSPTGHSLGYAPVVQPSMTQAPDTVAWQPGPHPSAALAALTIERLLANARAAITRIDMVEPSF